MKRKLITLAMTLSMSCILIACTNSKTNKQNSTDTSNTSDTTDTSDSSDHDQEMASTETIKVTTINENGEKIQIDVPYDPQRIAVLDLAALDIIDRLGQGNRIVGVAKGATVDYLQSYHINESISNLGTIKEADLEAVMACEPDVIFIGGRLSASYPILSEIAPVIQLTNDYEAGLLESVKSNATMIASLFGYDDIFTELFASYEKRVEALANAGKDRTALIGMVTSSSFSTLGNDSRCSIIGNEIGFENLATDVNSTHGNESSFELVADLNPEYIFVLDRDAAIGTEGAKLTEEVMNNELVQKTTAYQKSQIIYLTPAVWYTAEGGLTATDIMLKDLETALNL